MAKNAHGLLISTNGRLKNAPNYALTKKLATYVMNYYKNNLKSS